MAAKAEDAGQLQSEVKSIASKLGFPVAGVGFSHDEFAPELASKSVREKKEAKPSVQGRKEEEVNGSGTWKRTEKKGKKGKGKQKQGVEAASESRTFRSLLGSEEPSVWYEAAEALPKLLGEEDEDEDISDEVIAKRKATAEAQLKRERIAFEKKMRHDYRDAAYLEKVKIEGTSADRIAALTLSIRESSLANVSELEPLLIFMEKRKGSRELVARSMEALGELFRMYMLPDRKLRFFEQQPVHLLGEDPESAKHALYWYVEDLVKRAYARFIAALEACSCDPLDFLRERSLRLSMNLLGEKPEQEARLLATLVNRLGDRSKRLGSKVVMYLDILLQKHPHWKEVIAREVERFTLMPNTPMRAVHYGTAALNQMTFNSKNEVDRKVAQRLVDFYFTLFKMILDGHIGFRRDMEKKSEMKLKGGKFHKKKFAKRMLNMKKKNAKNSHDGSRPNQRIEEMDGRILNNLIVGVRRAIVHVHTEECDKLVTEHMNNLFRVVHVAPIGVGIQAITLLFQILQGQTSSGDRLYRALYARLAAPDLLHSSKLPLMVSTVFKAMKGDSSLARMTAFTKRLLQIGASSPPGIAAGFLLMMSELIKVHRGLMSSISQPEDGDTEDFKDIPTMEGPGHENNGFTGNRPQSNGENGLPRKKYQMGEREPLHCKAETCCLWELHAYLHHVHPTVSGMARSLLSLQPVHFVGDPLQDLELVPFLDKFQGKEARSHGEGSVFRPMGGVTASVTMKRVGSTAFEKMEQEEVGAEDLFFHKYYGLASVKGHRKSMSDRRRQRRGKKRSRDDEDGVGKSEPVDDMLSDDDDDFLDLEAEMDEPDMDKVIKAPKDKKDGEKEVESDEDYGYAGLTAALESDGLSGSDIELKGSGTDEDMSDDAATSNDDGVEMDNSEEMDDIELPGAEFPANAMKESSQLPPRERKHSKPKNKRRKKGGSVFAPAEDYEHLLNG